MRKIGLFLGCNIPLRRPDIEYSMRYVLNKLGVEIVELDGATCCPAFGIMPSIDLVGWCAGSAWNMAIAEEKEVDIITGCGSCYGSLNEARYHMEKHPEIKEEVNKILGKVGKKYEGVVKVWNFYNYIYEEIGIEELKKKIKYSLNDIVCGTQVGCHNLWPSKAYTSNDDNVFKPTRMREICEAVGGKAPWYSTILDCCGMGALGSLAKEKSWALWRRKVSKMIEEINPELFVTGCSSCLLRYDNDQAQMKKGGLIDFEIPAVHIAQLLALVMGAEPEKAVGLAEVPIDGIITKIKGGK
ncbi:MAG TPA: heterodisulfide reductase [Candidatus Atribacteria bacterium]|nr:CoB--CoM heterodisulfide reductase iron-sulfur subunit B family protein [Thermodesulfobacterium sp.]HDK25534.1 heterodisulfide reductase [Candidatus Atribacteria bacterium]